VNLPLAEIEGKERCSEREKGGGEKRRRAGVPIAYLLVPD